MPRCLPCSVRVSRSSAEPDSVTPDEAAESRLGASCMRAALCARGRSSVCVSPTFMGSASPHNGAHLSSSPTSGSFCVSLFSLHTLTHARTDRMVYTCNGDESTDSYGSSMCLHTQTCPRWDAQRSRVRWTLIKSQGPGPAAHD